MENSNLIPQIAAELVKFQNGFKNLSPEQQLWIIHNGRQAVDLIVETIKDKSGSLFLSDVIYSFNVQPKSTKALVKDMFNLSNEKINFFRIYEFINELFGNLSLEEATEHYIVCKELKMTLNQSVILPLIGINQNTLNYAETTPSDLYSCLLDQANGEDGWLFTDGRINAFYMRDINKELSLVYVIWKGNGWSLIGLELNNTIAFRTLKAGSVIFTREYQV